MIGLREEIEQAGKLKWPRTWNSYLKVDRGTISSVEAREQTLQNYTWYNDQSSVVRYKYESGSTPYSR